jgi:hypothetical protein
MANCPDCGCELGTTVRTPIDSSLAFTALLEHWPGLAEPEAAEIRRQLLGDWYGSGHTAMYDYAREWVAKHRVSPEKLNDRMEFDHVIRVGPVGTVYDNEGSHAPELVMETDDDFQILDEHEDGYRAQAERQGWQLLTGWTGQYGYRGLVMHPSEYVGGQLAEHILSEPGEYVVIAVECDQDSDPAGWAIAYREKAPEPDAHDQVMAGIREHEASGNPYVQYTPEARVWTIAQEHGKAAASWVVDGSTSAVSARGLVKGIEDGDPAVLDSIREPSLSGEFADDYSEDELMADARWVPNDGTDLRDELATQYNNEVSTAFWHEVDRLARNQIPEPEATEADG